MEKLLKLNMPFISLKIRSTTFCHIIFLTDISGYKLYAHCFPLYIHKIYIAFLNSKTQPTLCAFVSDSVYKNKESSFMFPSRSTGNDLIAGKSQYSTQCI